MERALAAARSRAAASSSDAGGAACAKGAAAPLARAGSAAQGGQQPDRLDDEYLSRSFGDNLPLLDLLLRQFMDKSLPEIERGLAQSLAASDLSQGRGAAHRARGTLASIGAARGANLAAGAEAAAVSCSMADFTASCAALRVELDGLREHLRQGLPWGPLKNLS